MRTTAKDEEKNLTELVSPFVLKMINVGALKYKKAVGSYGFGLKQKLSGWLLYILIAAIVVVVIALYFAGYIGRT